MDIGELAKQLSEFLLPFLPYLIKGGKIAARAAIEKTGGNFADATWKKAEELWGKLRPKVEAKPAAQDAVNKAINKPDDIRVQGNLELQMEDILGEDEPLANFVGSILKAGDDSIIVGGNVDGGVLATGHAQVTIHNHPAPQTPKRKPQKVTTSVSRSADELREAYLNGIINDCKRARLAGLDPQAADVTRGAFSLDRLYVSLDTKTQVEEKDTKRERNLPERARPLSALEAVWREKDRRMVLIGLPGSGKSTFVRYLALWHARALLDSNSQISDRLPDWKGKAIIPIIVPLGRLAESLPMNVARGTAEHVEKFVEQSLQSEKDFAPALLKEALQEGALFLFDGLDEVANLDLRPIVVQSVEEFSNRYGKNKDSRFLVTCRTFSYTDSRWKVTGWPTHELAPLTRKKIDEFVEYWHNECIKLDPAREADYQEKRKKLHDALRQGDHRRLWEIADNPLILTVMAIVHTHKGDLPDARALVYEDCIDVLLIRWEAERVVTGKSQRRDLRTALNVPDITLKNALQEVAYHAHERNPDEKRERQAALVTEDLLRADLFAAFNDEEKVQIFLDYCESANGLLMLQGVAPLPDAPPDSPERRVYAFPHLTFEEYLAARYLRRMKTLGQKTQEHLNRSDRWREVVKLLGEHICFKEGDYELMDSIIHTLAPETSPETMKAEDWRSRWMAGDLLILYRRAFPQRSQMHDHLPQTLVKLVKDNALTPRERASAGDTLARLGDPRFDAEHWYLPDESLLGFVHIPAGEFAMGTKKKDIQDLIKKYGGDKEWYEREVEQHTVSLPDFYLARYPVTVAQFQAFVTESGYQPRDENSLSGVPNHPVVYVTWLDAIAFCKWLNDKLKLIAPGQKGRNEAEQNFWQGIRDGKLTVTLPSEAEWEKAARGDLTPGPSPTGRGETGVREFPWGNDFDQNNANCNMVIGNTSAVGCFPQGRSPYEIHDMAGNVWEWTRSLWGKDWEKPKFVYPYKPTDGREKIDAPDEIHRVLRGGAFRYSGRYVRCAFRVTYSPHNWYDFIGFRVVVSPFF
ncbi:MAG: SUMF1/EgtB/PvdO family nonheme iron enzyme [Chloroflexota bacterium]